MSMNQMMMPKEQAREFPTLALFSTWFGLILVLLTALAAQNAIWAGPFIESLRFLLASLILASLLYLPFRAQQGIKLAALPLLINLGTLMIVELVPFGDLGETLRFNAQFSNYEAAVQMVQSGEIRPNESGIAYLPPAYAHLSTDNGRIWVQQEGATISIFFYTERHAPRNFAGYLYRSDDNPPQTGDFLGRWRVLTQKRPHWFYCVSS